MANTRTPSAPERVFSLSDAVGLMHHTVYGHPAAPRPRVNEAAYGAACDHLDTIYNASTALRGGADGLQLLCELLDSGGERVGLEAAHALALGGLLRPLAADMARHAEALKAAIARD